MNESNVMPDLNDLIKVKHDTYVAHRTLLESRRWDHTLAEKTALHGQIMTAHRVMEAADAAYKAERDRLVREAKSTSGEPSTQGMQ